MITHSAKWLNKMVALGLALCFAGAAHASLFDVTLNASITEDPTGIVPVGSRVIIDMVLDTATPNESLVPGDFLATNVGDFGFMLPDLSDQHLSAEILSIFSTASIWTIVGKVDLVPLGLPGFLNVTGAIEGIGLTPGQILPDFTSIISSNILVDLTEILGDGNIVLAAVDSINIEHNVPVPGTIALLGLGLLGLGAARRRKS